MTDDYWAVEVRNTDVGVLRGSWIRDSTWGIQGAAFQRARHLTSSCSCGERPSHNPDDVRVRRWSPGPSVDYRDHA